MKIRSIALFTFVAVMMGLGLFVNGAFFLVGMVGLCGGHMLLDHGKAHTHDVTTSEDEKKNKFSCH
jgi:hypothetical protein